MVSNRMNYLLDRFEGYIQKAMTDWQVPGLAIAIVKGDKLVYARGFGVKKLGGTDRVDEKTVFQIGSVSKTFTAALVSSLVDEGKITWKDKVKHHLRHFRLYDSAATGAFTIADLMSQCSGLSPYSGHLLPYLGYSRDYIINSLRHIKPVGIFRNDYAYQNNLFLVAAALVEKYTGSSWDKSLSRRILNPLEMKDTTTTIEGYKSSKNVALGHFYDISGTGHGVTPIPLDWPYHYWTDAYAPAGGINSNVLDMATWLKLHLNKGAFNGKHLISPANIKYMHTPKTCAGNGVWGELRHYCQGWIHSVYQPYPIIWHNGGTSGMKSIAAMVPEAQLGITVLTNLSETFLPEAVSRFLFDLWFENRSVDWSSELLNQQKETTKGISDPPAPYLPPRPLLLYTGSYRNDLYGPVTVSKAGRHLLMSLGAKNIKLTLRHWSGDTFVLYWPGVLTRGAGVYFLYGRTGTARAVRIEGMNDDLTGVFTRQGLKFNPDWLKNWIKLYNSR